MRPLEEQKLSRSEAIKLGWARRKAGLPPKRAPVVTPRKPKAEIPEKVVKPKANPAETAARKQRERRAHQIMMARKRYLESSHPEHVRLACWHEAMQLINAECFIRELEAIAIAMAE